MSCWLTIPSARPANEANESLTRWRAMGYKIAIWRDDEYAPTGEAYAVDCTKIPSAFCCDVMIVSPKYPGYAVAVNTLIKHVMKIDAEADWFVASGDDTWPDPKKTAGIIAADCSEYFAGRGPAERVDEKTVSMSIQQFELSRTFGVMQPTGDRWQDTPTSRMMFGENRGALIDRVAGSAFLGREFCRRILGGNGPFYPQFQHMFGDQALQCVAEKYGVFWQRRDLTHYHNHAQRTERVHVGPSQPLPPHLVQWNSRQHWDESKAEFERLQSAGFPGSEPIP